MSRFVIARKLVDEGPEIGRRPARRGRHDRPPRERQTREERQAGRHDRRSDRRDEPAKLSPLKAARRFSRPAAMGENLRVAAAEGFRAAVVEVKPGMYLVAEVPEEMLQTEVGSVAAVLAPMLIKSAAKAIHNRQQQQAAQTAPPPMAPQPAPAALPAPVAVAQLPAPAPAPAPNLVAQGIQTVSQLAAPALADELGRLLPPPRRARWMDPTTVAGAGCQCGCGRCGGV